MLNHNHNLVSGNDIFQQTKILMGLVVVFVLCQCFTMVADAYEFICTLSGSENNVHSRCPFNTAHVNDFISFAHFMLALNSTVNFVFYMVYIQAFRDAFFQVRCIWYWQNIQVKKYSYKLDYVRLYLYIIFCLFQSFCCCFVFYKRNINDSKSNRNLNENIDHADVNIPLDDMQMIEEIQP